jgi:hypothetical protein
VIRRALRIVLVTAGVVAGLELGAAAFAWRMAVQADAWCAWLDEAADAWETNGGFRSRERDAR